MDDVSGEPLILRDDDQEAIIRKRLEVYHEQTEPVIAFYKKWSESAGKGTKAPKYHHIPGIGSVETIFEKIKSAIANKEMESCQVQPQQ